MSGNKKLDASKRTVRIEFPNEKTANTFVEWMSEQGDQGFEDPWLAYRNMEDRSIPSELDWVYGFPEWNKQCVGTGDLLLIRAERPVRGRSK